MKMRFFLCACVLVLGFAGVGSADETSDYSMLMKPAAAANMALQKAVMGADWAAAATSATDVQNAFAKIEAFWNKRGGSDDAVGFAKNVQAAAKETHDAAAAGNADAATAASKKIGPNCGMCHMAHRGGSAGMWILK